MQSFAADGGNNINFESIQKELREYNESRPTPLDFPKHQYDYRTQSDLSHQPHQPHQSYQPHQPLKMSRGTIITLCVVCGIIFLVILFVTLYFTVWNKPNSDKLGTISARDSASGVNGPFYPGDTITLQYSNSDITDSVIWDMSTDGGITYPIVITSDSTTNQVQFDIPGNIFTDKAVFRASLVSDSHVSSISKELEIIPRLSVTAGPGTKQGVVVFTGIIITSPIQMDDSTSLQTALSFPSDFCVQTSTSPTDFTNAPFQKVISYRFGQLMWEFVSVPPVDPLVYYRITTTSLVANHFPSEISYTSSHRVKVIDIPTSCAANTNAFTICVAYMIDENGGSGNFQSGDDVLLAIDIDGTFPGSASWTYTINGSGVQVPIITLSGPILSTDKNTVSYTWKLPTNLVTNTREAANLLYLQVTSGNQTVASIGNFIEPSVVWDSPQRGSAVDVFSADKISQNYIITTVTLDSNITFSSISAINVGISTAVTDAPTYFNSHVFIQNPTDPKKIILYWSLSQTAINSVIAKTTTSANLIWFLQITCSLGTFTYNTGENGFVQFNFTDWYPGNTSQNLNILNEYNANFVIGPSTASVSGQTVDAVGPYWNRNCCSTNCTEPITSGPCPNPTNGQCCNNCYGCPPVNYSLAQVNAQKWFAIMNSDKTYSILVYTPGYDGNTTNVPNAWTFTSATSLAITPGGGSSINIAVTGIVTLQPYVLGGNFINQNFTVTHYLDNINYFTKEVSHVTGGKLYTPWTYTNSDKYTLDGPIFFQTTTPIPSSVNVFDPGYSMYFIAAGY